MTQKQIENMELKKLLDWAKSAKLYIEIFTNGNAEVQMEEENGDFFEYAEGETLLDALKNAYEKYFNGE